jgi:hypothetical protein
MHAPLPQSTWANHRRKAFLCLTSFSILFNLVSCGPVAGIGMIGGGVATKFVLQDLDDRASHIVQNAAAAGSLVSSKAARDVELLIDATRQNLKDDLDTQWNRLDREKVDLLRELNSQINKIENLAAGVEKLEDTVYLDTDSLVSRVPFAEKMPRIRRVEGASQYYKTDGTYTVRITSNVFTPFGAATQIFLNGKPLAVVPKPPYSAEVSIPNEMLSFSNFQVIGAPLTIQASIEQDSFFSKKKKEYSFTIPIQLFAKYPAYYQMDEEITNYVVDPSQVAVAKGALFNIPGCGDSGCNAYYNVCTNFPIGTQFTRTVNLYDSFSGWGGFGAAAVGTGQVCQIYWQHSHNTARNVSIDVEYHPLMPTTQHSAILLKPVVAGKTTAPLCTPSINGINPQPNQTVQPTALGTSNTVCWLQFGTAYLADFSPNHKGYTLAVHMFNGQRYAAVSGIVDKEHPGIDVQPVPGQPQAVFRLIEPKL